MSSVQPRDCPLEHRFRESYFILFVSAKNLVCIMSLRLLVSITAIFCISARTNACSSRRSPPPCSRRDCSYTSWGHWSACTTKCGYVGIKKRTRKIASYPRCGGKACDNNQLSQQASCPNTCCPKDCRYTWLSWSACSVTCGNGKRTRQMRIDSKEKCGGKACPTQRTETKDCKTGR